MKKIILLNIAFFLVFSLAQSQDTFSIVAVDPLTGEVGSAGASCVDLFTVSVPNDHFISELFPGVGAINTQAAYVPINQTRARIRMNAGDTPSEIITYMINNDFQNNPTDKQYGIAAYVNGSPQTAAHTGNNCLAYANQITGPNYSIQGNILLGQQVLDNMEANFLNTQGDLACKLMAALQGAKLVGADTRCAPNGTFSLFAFVKVAQPDDTFGNPSFVLSVKTADGAGTEPIDALQTMFDNSRDCVAPPNALTTDNMITILPCPANNTYVVTGGLDNFTLNIVNTSGTIVQQFSSLNDYFEIDISTLPSGMHFIQIVKNGSNDIYIQQIIKLM